MYMGNLTNYLQTVTKTDVHKHQSQRSHVGAMAILSGFVVWPADVRTKTHPCFVWRSWHTNF